MLFSTVNYDAKNNHEDNPLSELVRYEFTELLVRIAHKLYPNHPLEEAVRILV